jgi:hypothetical protein
MVRRSDGRPPALQFEVIRQLEGLLRAIPPTTVISGASDFLSADPIPEFVEAFVHLYGRTAPVATERLDLDDRSRALVRPYLKNALTLILEEDDFSGAVKAELGSVLSQIGEPEDIEDLMKLVRADLKRVSDGRAALARGERTTAADGAVMSWTRSYVAAIATLMRANADDVLLTLFREAEYETSLLEEYARQLSMRERREIGRPSAYGRIWQARTRRAHVEQNESRRTPRPSAREYGNLKRGAGRARTTKT